jgi:aubergine
MPMKGVMIAGFDVSHSTQNRNKSYGAFVASMDLQKTVKWYSGVSVHTNGVEISNNIKLHLNKALLCFRQEHGCLPERVLFYRDGVGDGQIEYVFQNEVQELKKTLEQVYTDEANMVKFAFVIVNKRINTRFFTKFQERNETKFGNPQSGCVVDDGVTLPER